MGSGPISAHPDYAFAVETVDIRTCSTKFDVQILLYRVTQKKYSCLTKREMHNKRRFFTNETCLDCQWADLNFDMLVLSFGCHLAEI